MRRIQQRFGVVSVMLCGLFAAGGTLCGADLDKGDVVPAFECLDDSGAAWKSSEHVGKKIVVVYFYPAAMTPGCTKQACAFRDDLGKLTARGVEVVGVSGDSVEGQALFKRAHELNFALLADEKGAVAKTFGVPTRDGGSIQRTVDGKEFTLTRGVTASRWTFVIGKDGRVAHKDTGVNAEKDSANVLQVVKALESGGVWLQVGDAAPVFEAVDDAGKTWRSKEHVGKKALVVYFYPADMTGGCTKQACAFRDDKAKLAAAGVEVIGVSGDSAENHRVFKKAHELNFTLLADEKGELARKFGVPLRDGASIEREVDGKKLTLTRGVTASRWTFVIDEKGKVAFKNTAVKAADDSKAILEFLAKREK